MSRDVIIVAHSSNTVPCARDSFSVMTAAGTVPMLTVSWHPGFSIWSLHFKGIVVSGSIVSVPVRCGHRRRFMPDGYSRGWSSCARGMAEQLAAGTLGQLPLITAMGAGSEPWQTRSIGTDNISADIHTSSWFVAKAVGTGTTSTVLLANVGNITSSTFSATLLALIHSLIGHSRMACQWWAEKSLFSTINISLYVGVLDVMIIHNSGIRFKALMLGVLWPVVHITQHPEPMYPAVANTSSNSRLGDVCQSQLWPMGSSHTLSHSINSNRYLTQMCHAYPDISFTLNWHNSRGNNITAI